MKYIKAENLFAPTLHHPKIIEYKLLDNGNILTRQDMIGEYVISMWPNMESILHWMKSSGYVIAKDKIPIKNEVDWLDRIQQNFKD